MSEDEFDFAELNPGELLATDGRAKPFDYEAQLRQKGYTKNSSPDASELFKTLATEYVPTVVVKLPPKVVERVKVVRRPEAEDVLGIIVVLLLILMYLSAVTYGGIIAPYQMLDQFVFKTHMQGGATCTVTRTYIDDSYSNDNGNPVYNVHVYFVLKTPNGKSYHTEDYWPAGYNTQADARSYASEFRIKGSYYCWYNSLNPTEATFFKQDIGPGDYAGLFFGACLFLLFIVLPVGLLTRVLYRAFLRRRRRRI